MERLKGFAEQIIAFVPDYDQTGSITRILTSDGREITQTRSIQSCLKEFWQLYSFDHAAYRRVYGLILGKRNLLPWPADVRRTFAPLKLRKPRFAGDNAYGYVAVEWICDMLDSPSEPGRTRIHLHSGQLLDVCLRPPETRSHLQAAAFAFQVFWGKRLEIRPVLNAETVQGMK